MRARDTPTFHTLSKLGADCLPGRSRRTPVQSGLALFTELFLISLTAAAAAFATVRLDEERQIRLRRGKIRRRMEIDWAKSLIQESKLRAPPRESSQSPEREHMFLDSAPGADQQQRTAADGARS